MRAITLPSLILSFPASGAFLYQHTNFQASRLPQLETNQLTPLTTECANFQVSRLLQLEKTAYNRRQWHLRLSPVEAWDAYNEALVSNPLPVKSVTAGIILGAADLAGQTLESIQRSQKDAGPNGPYGIDWARAARFAVFGLVLQAPWNHFYYLVLDGQIPPTPNEPFSQSNLVKTFIDQAIQAPCFTVLIFVFLGVLEGKDASAIQAQLKNDYKETLFANWKLWVPATVINIGFVPPILRVLYLNVVFFFWSIYLSLVLNKPPRDYY